MVQANVTDDNIAAYGAASEACSLPSVGRVGSSGYIPGWNDIVAPVRDKSIFLAQYLERMRPAEVGEYC